jgi:hypothetical protein
MQSQITALVLGEHGLRDAETLSKLELGDVARLADCGEAAPDLGSKGGVIDGCGLNSGHNDLLVEEIVSPIWTQAGRREEVGKRIYSNIDYSESGMQG